MRQATSLYTIKNKPRVRIGPRKSPEKDKEKVMGPLKMRWNQLTVKLSTMKLKIILYDAHVLLSTFYLVSEGP